MTAPMIAEGPDTLLGNIIVHAPDEWSVPECASALVAMLYRMVSHRLGWGDDLSPVWPATPAEWEAVRESGAAGSHIAGVAERVRGDPESLAASLRALVAGQFPDSPLPRNDFAVSRYRRGLFLGRELPRELTPDQALNLGVWLIAMADPDLGRAVPYLAKVATR